VLQIAIMIILESLFFQVWFVFLSYKGVNSSVMNTDICAIDRVPNTENYKSLRPGDGFSWWCNKEIVYDFGWKSGHYFAYEFGPRCDILINQDAKQKIIDAPWTLIFRMGQGVCVFGFLQRRRPILHFCLFVTSYHLDYPRWKARNCWRWVDTDFRNGFSELSVLPMKAANKSIMNNFDQTDV